MTTLTGEWATKIELLTRRPYTPPVQDPPGVPPLRSPKPNKDFPGGIPQDPPPVPVAPPVDLADVRPGMLGIPGSEEEGTKFPMPIIEGEFPGDPGIGPDSVPTPTQQYYDPVQTIAELNPAQIEALKKIPANIKDLPDDERLDTMRRITDEVNKAKGLA